MSLGHPALLDDLLARTPTFTAEEQEAGVAVYRLLSQGTPVGEGDVAAALEWDSGRATDVLGRANLRSITYRDAEGRIVGFGGLAIPRMAHRFRLDKTTLHTWCAWDSLFVPVVLGRQAEVESEVPGGGLVRLVVGPEGVIDVDPAGAVMSFLLPTADAFDDDALKAMASFCHFIFFFPDEASGEAWCASHPGTMVLSLGEAFELGRGMTLARWGDALDGAS